MNIEIDILPENGLAKRIYNTLCDQHPYLALNNHVLDTINSVINQNPIPATMPLEQAVKHAVWGTYGKCGTQPLRYVRLIDCSTEHLLAILRTQPHISSGVRFVINHILNSRKIV